MRIWIDSRKGLCIDFVANTVEEVETLEKVLPNGTQINLYEIPAIEGRPVGKISKDSSGFGRSIIINLDELLKQSSR